MELLFLPEAEEDIRAARSWYAGEAFGLGEAFLTALGRCLDRIREQPRGFPRVDGEIRRALVRPFPYGVFYLDGADAILVLACMHASRAPDAWKRQG